MDVEALVRTISRRVIQQIEGSTSDHAALILGEPESPEAALLVEDLGGTTAVRYVGDSVAACEPNERPIVALLSCAEMADLAVGRATTPMGRTILELLLAGRCVEVFRYAFHRYRDTAPPALYGLYEEQQARLETFGLHPLRSTVTSTSTLNKRVVTERDLQMARQQGLSVVQLGAQTRVTPLAADYARCHGIELAGPVTGSARPG